jgi:hypothetical protein
MRHLRHGAVVTSLLLSGVFASGQGVSASGQVYSRGQNRQESYDRDRDRDQARLIDRTRADLDHLEATTSLPLTPDRVRIVRAQEKVAALDGPMDASEYSRHLDDAIAALQRVADSNRNLSDSDRDHVASDLSRLRGYQSWLEESR